MAADSLRESIPRHGLRLPGVQSVIAPDIEDALAWWHNVTGLRPAAVGRSADVTVVHLASPGRRRAGLNVVSGAGAGEYRDLELYYGVERASQGRITRVDDPWSNTVYCLTARGLLLLPLTTTSTRIGRR